LINIKWAPPPRILVGELDKPRHDAAPALDGVHRQAACEHLSSPSIDHRVEHCLVGSKQRNVIAAQNLWNEAGQFLNHVGSRPEPGRPSTQLVASIARRHKSIRHSDVSLMLRVREEGPSNAGYTAGRREHAQGFT
jgi:hypothetical protein